MKAFFYCALWNSVLPSVAWDVALSGFALTSLNSDYTAHFVALVHPNSATQNFV